MTPSSECTEGRSTRSSAFQRSNEVNSRTGWKEAINRCWLLGSILRRGWNQASRIKRVDSGDCRDRVVIRLVREKQAASRTRLKYFMRDFSIFSARRAVSQDAGSNIGLLPGATNTRFFRLLSASSPQYLSVCKITT